MLVEFSLQVSWGILQLHNYHAKNGVFALGFFACSIHGMEPFASCLVLCIWHGGRETGSSNSSRKPALWTIRMNMKELHLGWDAACNKFLVICPFWLTFAASPTQNTGLPGQDWKKWKSPLLFLHVSCLAPKQLAKDSDLSAPNTVNSLCRQIEESYNELSLPRKVWWLIVIGKSSLTIQNAQMVLPMFLLPFAMFFYFVAMHADWGCQFARTQVQDWEGWQLAWCAPSSSSMAWRSPIHGQSRWILDGQCACCSAMFIKLPEC